MPKYDAVIVGASVSGCTAARMLGRRGARVLVVDRVTSPDSYKTACTHFIQAGALPAIERMGLKQELEDAGAIATTIDGWTPWGWIQPRPSSEDSAPAHGYNVRRQTLDPLLRQLAADTPGVDVELGWKLERLDGSRGAIPTVDVRHQDGRRRQIEAPLIVGADGRDSAVAKLGRIPTWRSPNNRVAYFAHYEQLPLEGASCRMWFLNPDGAAAWATDGGITLLSLMLARERAVVLAEDLEQRFENFFARLPWPLPIQTARRVSKVIGRRDMTTTTRPPAWGPVALIGDAATSADPLQGIGLGWAFESGEMLAACVGDHLDRPEALRRALRRYARQHVGRFAAHQLLSNYVALALPYSPLERAYLRAAANDAKMALEVYRFSSRDFAAHKLLRPSTLARLVRVNARLSRTGQASPDPHSAPPQVSAPTAPAESSQAHTEPSYA